MKKNPEMSKKLRRAIELCTLLTVFLLMLFRAWTESYVFCEHGRLASGAVYLRTGDFFPFHVNPPLVSLAAAVSSMVMGANPPNLMLLSITSLMRIEGILGESFVEANPNHFLLVFAGRCVCILLSLFGLLALLRRAPTMYRASTPILILFLLGFLPYFLGFGSVINSDVISAVFGGIAVSLFIGWLRHPDRSRMLCAGIALGLAELTKFTLILFYPLFLVMFLFFAPKSRKSAQIGFRSRLLQFAGICAMSLVVINLGYLFEGTGRPLRSFHFQTKLLTGKPAPSGDKAPAVGNRFDGSGNRAERGLGYLPMPLPVNYIQGIDTQRLDFERGLPSYLRGKWSNHGWFGYYFYALLIKTPLGTIGILVLAVFCSLFLKGYNAPWREEVLTLLPGIAILLFVSCQTGFSKHSRYIIPALPFFIVWMSKVGRAFTPELKAVSPASSRVVRVLTVFFAVWSIGSSLWVYPHSIAYFNELAALIPTPEDPYYPKPEPEKRSVCKIVRGALDAGPLNGPRHLLDSNIDWGQDILGLERWCKSRPEITEMKTVLSGSYPVKETGIPSAGYPPVEPEPGWYALSANFLYDEQKSYRYFLNFRPAAVIGYTIYVYHIMQEEIRRGGGPNRE